MIHHLKDETEKLSDDNDLGSIVTPYVVNMPYYNKKGVSGFSMCSKPNSNNNDETTTPFVNTLSPLLDPKSDPVIYNTDDETSGIGFDIAEYSLSKLDKKLKEIKKNREGTSKRFNNLNFDSTPPYPRTRNSINDTTQKIKMNPNTLIHEHLEEIQLRTKCHTVVSIMYMIKERRIGLPVTVLSGFVSGTTMLSITNDYGSNMYVKIISLILAIVTFILSVSRGYLRYAEKFHSHDVSAKLYTTLLRQNEIRLIENHIGSSERKDIFKDLVAQMSIIEQYETPIPKKIERKIRLSIGS